MAMAVLALSVERHALPIFLLAMMIAGVGYSLLFLGGLELVNSIAPAGQRGGVLSALYLVGYLFQGLIAMTLGQIATVRGLASAIDIGAIVVAALGFATLCALPPKP